MNDLQYKILVIDDEEMITDLLRDFLSDNGYMVYIANSACEGLKKIKCEPDLILLDINMPEMSGLEFCNAIRDEVACPILFLTARVSEQEKIQGLLSGGDDYITKPFSLAELDARIKAHLRRENRGKHRAELLTSNELIVNLSRHTVSYRGEEIAFSKYEFGMIEFLLMNEGQVFDKERIYESVWGYDAEGDSSVVKEHIRKIRQKLQKSCGKDYIETVWGVGYRWNRQ